MNSSAEETMIKDRLHTVYEKTESGDYDGAFANLAVARSSDPGNIYMVALERQLKTIMELLDAQELGEDRREELIEPMTGLIECAVRDLNRPDRPGAVGSSQSHKFESAVMPPLFHKEEQRLPRATEPKAPEDQVQKELEGLKLLYFQRASKFVTNGELEKALAEVRRVFEVDPDNTIAKQYAARVENLIEEARHLSSGSAPTGKRPASAPNRSQGRLGGISQRMRRDDEESGDSPQSAPPEESRAVSESQPSPQIVQPSQSSPSPGSGRVSQSQPSARSGRVPQSQPSARSGGTPKGGGSSQSARSPKSERGPGFANRTAPQAYSTHDVFSEHVPEGSGKVSARIVVPVIALAVIMIAGGLYALLFVGRASSPPGVRQAPADIAVPVTEPGVVPGPGGKAVSEEKSSEQKLAEVKPAEQKSAGLTPSKQNRDDAALTPKKPLAEVQKSSPPPPAEQPSKVPAAKPAALKSDPGKNAVTKTEQKPVSPPLAAIHKEAPPAGGAGVPDTKPAEAETPAFVPVQKEPQIVKLEQPVIPNLVWMTGSVEQVIVKVLIDATGKPIDTQVLKSTKTVLEKPVIEAVMNSKFQPAQSATGPVKTWLTIPFKFKSPR
jgi:TonB family protein